MNFHKAFRINKELSNHRHCNICLPHIVLSFISNYSHPLAPHKTSVTEYPLQICKFEMQIEILSILKINEILQILLDTEYFFIFRKSEKKDII